MLFNSHIYILLFLPGALLGYYMLAKRSDRASKAWLVIASLFSTPIGYLYIWF
jgi:hypothetical protein